eukprot:Skav212251  [mRNA]  locus=scaffold499:95947:96399:- [translate_table: standard]
MADGSVVTWGDPLEGGNSDKVQTQLRNVQQIRATSSAFAALLADGRVVTWGSSREGGDSSEVQDQLQNVQQIHARGYAFAAILADDRVVTWGNPQGGGDNSFARGWRAQHFPVSRGALAIVPPVFNRELRLERARERLARAKQSYSPPSS